MKTTASKCALIIGLAAIFVVVFVMMFNRTRVIDSPAAHKAARDFPTNVDQATVRNAGKWSEQINRYSESEIPDKLGATAAIDATLKAYFSGSRQGWSEWAIASDWLNADEVASISEATWWHRMQMLERNVPQWNQVKIKIAKSGELSQPLEDGLSFGRAVRRGAAIAAGENSSELFEPRAIELHIPLSSDVSTDPPKKIVYIMTFQQRKHDHAWALTSHAFAVSSELAITWPP